MKKWPFFAKGTSPFGHCTSVFMDQIGLLSTKEKASSPVRILRINNKEMVFYGEILSEIIFTITNRPHVAKPNQYKRHHVQLISFLDAFHEDKCRNSILSPASRFEVAFNVASWPNSNDAT